MKKRIEGLLKKVGKIDDDELNSHFLNYICVLISGHLETELEKIIDKYKKSKHCKNHECSETISSMRKIQNAKWCSIRPILMNIDDKILNEIKRSIGSFEQTIGSIDNVVKNRHKVSHGKDVTNLTKNNLAVDLSNIDSFVSQLQQVFNTL
ncbi:HEPN domain-containing protein [Bathymodiolus thermophilus thioautotrophic gill symbiont]|uniref:RiboL-PSP-HEPN domain-containing protein n=1 Tax=Bathymodiolus thermophilus thioautotrophic gill symbiont TaxID=2360 RepID=A0A8H9CEX2_9GAMM|nr:HEPN domain-containing protein [Bathymodiolus thermophilus thioautotrophic gill symbiont]CAB5495326.1 hypothetical protein THERMOS_282 [Bathymodiolus thermophilus thioautotrophic gill symbiont]